MKLPHIVGLIGCAIWFECYATMIGSREGFQLNYMNYVLVRDHVSHIVTFRALTFTSFTTTYVSVAVVSSP